MLLLPEGPPAEAGWISSRRAQVPVRHLLHRLSPFLEVHPDNYVWIMQKQHQRVLTAPERVGEPAVDSAVELLVDGPEDARAQLNEVYDEAADHEHEAHQQLQDEQALQVGQQSHGSGARRAEEAPLHTTTDLRREERRGQEVEMRARTHANDGRKADNAALLTTVDPFISRVYTVLRPELPTWRREKSKQNMNSRPPLEKGPLWVF